MSVEKNLKNALRWYKQAEHDFKACSRNRSEGDYSWAWFLAQQSAERVLKSLIIAYGIETGPIHGFKKLTELTPVEARDILTPSVLSSARSLSVYYIPTRYPDAVDEDEVPFEIFDDVHAQLAENTAKTVLDAVKRVLDRFEFVEKAP